LYASPEAIAEALAGMAPENRERFRAAAMNREKPVSAVCLPLITDQSTTGTLLLESRNWPGGLGPADLPFLQAISEIIAQFVESAHLACERQTALALDEGRRLKTELISNLAHEMRTPLTSVKGYSTALLMDEVSFSPETQREFLQFIDEGCDVLQGLIEDLLESSNIDAGLMRLEPQPVRVPPLVQSVVNELARHTSEHRFLLDFTDDFPIVDADPDRLAQVLRNLLDNAIKYSPEGGLIVVRGEVHKDEILVSVADQGVGLTPEHLNRLFEKFFRAKSSFGRHVVGSGLGLPISRTIVESHGGRIWAESQMGEGTTLYFTLPLEGLSQELAEREER
jgi:signal transduction histidine kinase